MSLLILVLLKLNSCLAEREESSLHGKAWGRGQRPAPQTLSFRSISSPVLSQTFLLQ